MRWLACLPLLWLATLTGLAQDSGGYRGPQRNGVHPSNIRLASRWPEQGPPLLWCYPRKDEDIWLDAANLGAGFCNVTVKDGVVYTAGLRDDGGEKNLYGFAFSLEGQLKWAVKLGKCLEADRFAGPRATPEADSGRVYFTSGRARVFCVSAADGQLVWQVDTAQPGIGNSVTGWGYNISPLLVDGKLILPVRRGKFGMVALDAATGKQVWGTPAWGDVTPTDSSPVVAEVDGRRFVMLNLFREVVAVDLATGAMAWQQPGQMSTCMTPVVAAGQVFLDLNYQLTHLRPQLNAGKLSFQTVRQFKVGAGLNQAVVLGDRLYRVSGSITAGSLQAIELATGRIVAEQRCSRAPRSLIAADSKLFSIGSNHSAPADGKGQYREEALIEMFRPTQDGLEPAGSFKPLVGTKEVYVAPVIAEGRLFHRHGTRLAVYDLRSK